MVSCLGSLLGARQLLKFHTESTSLHIQVPRDYAAFEKLQKDVLEAYPNLQLPGLPRKFHVFFDDSDVEERQVAFDCLVKVIAKHKEMCCSSALLNFLGFSLLADREYYKVAYKLT